MVSSMNVNEQAADLLEEAADGYQSGQYQWIQGDYVKPVQVGKAWELGYCSLGILRYLGRDNSAVHVRAASALSEQIGPQVYGVKTAIPAWNDTVGRTQDEVIDAFKHAAKDLRNQETQ